MPAGPAPTTATRRGRSTDGGRGVPSSGTTGILHPAGPRGASSAGQVAIETALHVLGQPHPAARRERRFLAVPPGAGQRGRTGQPAGAAGEVAGGGHVADDLAPLLRRRVETDAAAPGEQVGS